MIGGHFPLWNGLWPLWYILYKIWYILYKIWYILHKIWYILKNIWYIQSLSYRNLYLITHGPFISLEIFGKWLKVVPYFKTDFGTLGTSLRKFDTSNPWANRTPISFPIVHFFLWRPSGSDWRLFPTLEQILATLVHPILELPGPLSYYPWSIHSFRGLWKVIGGHSLLQNKLWNPRYILKKIWYIQSLS